MAIRNTTLRFLRGMFAALIAMCVVVSTSVHASASGDHAQPITLSSGLEAGAASLHGDHDVSPQKAAPLAGKTGTSKDGQASNDPCKMQCAFSMIMPIEHDAMVGHGRAPWAVAPMLALLPEETVAEPRPPRS